MTNSELALGAGVEPVGCSGPNDCEESFYFAGISVYPVRVWEWMSGTTGRRTAARIWVTSTVL